MKKKFLAMLLMLSLCLSLFIPMNVQAADEADSDLGFSEWAIMDLVEGDCYEIYPLDWYSNLVMTQDLTPEYFGTLISGFEKKVLSIKGGKKLTKTHPTLTEEMTVKDVLNTFYVVISNLKFKGSIGMEDSNGVINFMKEAGIYTGKNGEPALKETCTVEDACVYATRLVTYVYDKLEAGSKGFLWTVEANGNTVYMLGSIHAASSDIYPFRPMIRENYKTADYLVEEVNIFDSNGIMDMMNSAIYTDDTTLKDHVSNEVYEEILKVADYIGVSREQIVYFKPWYLTSLFTSVITAASGSDQTVSSSFGIDLYFATKNYLQEKPIYEIEGYSQQVKMFENYSDELNEFLLAYYLQEINHIIDGKTTDSAEVSEDIIVESNESLSIWLKNWKDGDVDAFTKNYDKSGSSDGSMFTGTAEELTMYNKLMEEYTSKLFVERDKGMAEYIDTLLKNGQNEKFFVVVGAGHYTGETSVITLLNDMGYHVNYVE